MDMRDYSTLHLDIYSSKGTACLKKKDMDVNGHGRLFNVTLRHTFK